MTVYKRWITLAIVTLGLAAPSPARATSILFNVSVDVGSLSIAPGSASGPFSLFFQLTDGSGGGDGNNTVTLSSFSLQDGTFTPSTLTFGGATGNVTTSVTLTDTSFFNAFQQGFAFPSGLTPASRSLSFLVNMTTNVDQGGVPDAFAFSILDGTGSPSPTLDPLLTDTLLTVNIDSKNPLVTTYGTDADRTRLGMGAPAINAITAVPEPGTLCLVGGGVLALVRRTRGRRD
jgi:hypothetical protein